MMALAVLVMTSAACAGLTAYASYDTTTDFDYTLDGDFGVKLHWGAGSVASVPGSDPYPAGESDFAGRLDVAGQTMVFDEDGDLDIATTFADEAGTVEMWVAPNWNGTNHGGEGVGGAGAAQYLFLGGNRPWMGDARGAHVFIFNNGFPNDGGQVMGYWDGNDGQTVTFENSPTTPSGSDMYGTTADWVAGQWHHIAFCWDATTLGLYMDGGVIMQAARASVASEVYLNGEFLFGYSPDGEVAQNCWDGQVDGFAVWNEARYTGPYAVPAGPHQPLTGDLNGDGFVGQSDLDIVLAMWGRNGGDIVDPRADINGDDFVGQIDLDHVLGDWGRGTPPTPPVPEPATAALIGIGGLAALRRRK